MVGARTCNCIGKRTPVVTGRVDWWVRRPNVAGYSTPVGATILDKIKWNSKPPSTPQIKDEAARRAKTRHFPILDLGRRGGLGFPFILSKIVACEQALYLGESQEVTQEQHAKRDSRLASLPIHGEPANRLCWSQLLVSLATVFVSSRNAPPFAVWWGGALRDETKTVALNPGHMLGGERSHHCSTLDLMTDSSLP